eukprot:scaffold63509_cov63-Phaeocystis_antarctica.AAC.5
MPLAVPLAVPPVLADQRFERRFGRHRRRYVSRGVGVDRRRAEAEDIVPERGEVTREEPRAVFPLGAERDVAAPIARCAAAHTRGCGALPAGSLALTHRPRALGPSAAVTGVRSRAAWTDEYVDSTACAHDECEDRVHWLMNTSRA